MVAFNSRFLLVCKMFYFRLKSFLDFFVALFSLIILSPFLIVVVFIVRWRLGSPVFTQQRPGYHGAPFGCSNSVL